ncbi:MAG: hypothetical protein DRJ57_02670 [Thermoprotei archaeon]|nr:MAG: hypothetical protein DRJ57_02670 [Thermoprotei archaeon]
MNVLEALLLAAWITTVLAMGYFQPTPLALACALSAVPYTLGILTGRRFLLAVAVALQLPGLIQYSINAENIVWSCAILLFAIYLAEAGDLVARSRHCIDRGYVRRRVLELSTIAGSSLAFTVLLFYAVLPAAGFEVDFGELVAILLLLLLLASLLFSSSEGV